MRKIGARPARGREVDRERGIVHPRAELPTRDARLGHFEDDATDLPPLAHDRAGDFHARHGEVLAEDAVLELAAELPFPPNRVFARVRVHRLVRSAVELGGGLLVSPDVHSAHRHAPFDRRLPDGRFVYPPHPFDLARRANIDRQQLSAHGNGARSLTKPGCDSTRAIHAAIAGRPDMSIPVSCATCV